jgi:hypothetical protein
MRIAVILTVALATFLMMMWLAEDSLAVLALVRGHASGWVVVTAIAVAIAYVFMVALLFRRYRWRIRLVGAVILFGAVLGGLTAGDRSQTRAYNECVANASILQARIERFRQRSGHYPASIDEVGDLPCRRILRGTIVTYERTHSGYQVGFRDWLVRWRGSEQEPITATK